VGPRPGETGTGYRWVLVLRGPARRDGLRRALMPTAEAIAGRRRPVRRGTDRPARHSRLRLWRNSPAKPPMATRARARRVQVKGRRPQPSEAPKGAAIKLDTERIFPCGSGSKATGTVYGRGVERETIFASGLF